MVEMPDQALMRIAAALASPTVCQSLLAKVAADRAFPAEVAEINR